MSNVLRQSLNVGTNNSYGSSNFGCDHNQKPKKNKQTCKKIEQHENQEEVEGKDD